MNSRVYILLFVFVICSSFAAVLSEDDSYDFTFYTRADWGAKPATDIEPINKLVPYVIIHHTYIPAACYNKDECSTSMRSMQNYHISQDWGDIGYNFCLGNDGAVYEGRGWETIGIHAGKANKYSIGICLIGDWRIVLPPAQMLATTQALIAAGVDRGYLSPDYKLIGHNQTMATECPGGALFAEITKWKHFSNKGFINPST